MSCRPEVVPERTVEALRRELAERLAGVPGPWVIEVFERLGSTQDLARERAEAGAPEGRVVLALAQSRGRGRRGRRWLSPRGAGLYVSVVFRPRWKADEACWLPVVSVLALLRALEARGLTEGRIDPPNDVVTPRGKLAGVLVEPSLAGGRIVFAVVGLGLNLTETPEEWARLQLNRPVTSCRMEGLDLGVADALAGWLRELATLYRPQPLAAEVTSAWLSEWMQRGGAPELPTWP